MWRVRGVLANGVFTAYSPPRLPVHRSRVSANDSGVPPTSPPDDLDQALTDVVLDWEPIKGAKSYELQISTNQLFEPADIVDHQNIDLRHPLLAAQRRSTTTSTTGGSGPPTRPVSSRTGPAGRCGGSSAPGRTSRRLAATRPNSATDVGDPFYYQWTPVKHASSLRGAAQQCAGFATPAPFPSRCTTVHTTLVYGDGDDGCTPTRPAGPCAGHLLVAGHRPRRVLQRDAASRRDRRPGRARFTYNPRQVTPTAPASGSDATPTPTTRTQSLGQPVLKWNPVAGADRYKVTDHRHDVDSPSPPLRSRYAPRDLAPGSYSLGRAHRRRTRLARRARDRPANLHDQPQPMVPDRTTRTDDAHAGARTHCPRPAPRTRPPQPRLVVPVPRR